MATEAVQQAEDITRRWPDAPKFRSDLGAALNDLAQILMSTQPDSNRIEPMLVPAIDEQQQAIAYDPQDQMYREFLLNHYWSLAQFYERKPDADQTRQACENAIDVANGLLNDFAQNRRFEDILRQLKDMQERLNVTDANQQ